MDYILSSEASTTPEFGNSIYKVACYVWNSYAEEDAFFLDTRDCGYGSGGSYGYNDFTIKYIQAQHKFYMVEGKGVQFNDIGFIDVTNKIVKLWDMEPTTWGGIYCYDNFWQNCLGIGIAINQHLQIIWDLNPDQNNITKYYLYRKIDTGDFTKIGEFNNQTFSYQDQAVLYNVYNPTNTISYKVSSYNGTESFTDSESEEYIGFDWNNGLILTNNGIHPKLVWVPNTSFSGAYYRIYRAVSNYPVNPASLNYTLVQSVNSSTFEFTDNAVTILPGYQYAYYYVVGWSGTIESAKTNYVGTPAEFQKIQSPEPDNEIPKEFVLCQNHPNPFNPSTKIKYAIKEKGNVELKIFDMLGSEIATLVNEEQTAGLYEVIFDASNLSSGVYLYTIKSGSFIQTRKMLLMK